MFMNKIINNFEYHKITKFITILALFLLPFLYIPNNFIIFGAEIYSILNPWTHFLNSLYIWIDLFGFGLINSYANSFFYHLVLLLINLVFDISITSKILIGCLLSLGYMSIYNLLEYIQENSKKNTLILLILSLLYLCNSFFLYSFSWLPTYGILFILTPQIIKYLLKLKQSNNTSYLIRIFILLSLFSIVSINLGLFVIPYMLMFIFIALCRTNKFKHLTYFFIFSILINAFWLLPSSYLYKSMYSEGKIYNEIKNNTKLFDKPIINAMTLNEYYWFDKKDSFGNYYYDFSEWYKPTSTILFLLIFIVIIYSLLKKDSKHKNIIFLSLILGAIFLSKGTSDPFGFIYQKLLINLKIFAIFRASDLKFSFITILFLIILLNNIVQNKKGAKVLLFITLIILAVPLFKFDFISKKSIISIPDYWKQFQIDTNKRKNVGRLLLLPRNNSPFDDYVWGYEANWLTTNNIINQSSIGYTEGYGYSEQEKKFAIIKHLYSILEKEDFLNFYRLSSVFNIKQLLVRNDFDLEKNSKNTNSYGNKDDFYRNGYESIIENNLNIKNTFGLLALYKIPNKYFTQIVYPGQRVTFTNKEVFEFNNNSNQDRKNILIFFKNQNVDKLAKLDNIKIEIINTPILEFKKINPIKYRVVVHGAKSSFPLVFSESFHDGWKAYVNKFTGPVLTSNVRTRASESEKLSKYKILDGNEEDQASRGAVLDFIDKGWISTLGDGKEKEIKHMKWTDNKEQLDYVEKYNIDFISKNFQDTIQNDNLSDGNIFETWFASNDNVKQISGDRHLQANGYANSWIINTNEVCAGSDGIASPAKRGRNDPSASSGQAWCRQNTDGTYDFEMIVEFWPQRLFYIGGAISLSTFLGCIIYLIYDKLKKPSASKAMDCKEKSEALPKN